MKTSDALQKLADRLQRTTNFWNGREGNGLIAAAFSDLVSDLRAVAYEVRQEENREELLR